MNNHSKVWEEYIFEEYKINLYQSSLPLSLVEEVNINICWKSC